MGFVHIDHVGLVANSIEQARQVLGDAVGLDLDEARSQWPDGSYFAPEQTYNYFFQVGAGETQVEVLIPAEGATSGAAKFLQRRGPSLHHIGYACEDVHAEAERMVANGMEEIDIPRRPDGVRSVAFFHPRTAGGILTELVPVRSSLTDGVPTVHRHGNVVHRHD